MRLSLSPTRRLLKIREAIAHSSRKSAWTQKSQYAFAQGIPYFRGETLGLTSITHEMRFVGFPTMPQYELASWMSTMIVRMDV